MCHCHECGAAFKSDGVGTGYGITKEGNKVCYACCAKHDEQALMALTGKNKLCLYLVGKDGQEEVTNWPGTLRIKLRRVKKGRHGSAGTRRDVWFAYKGKHFHGTQYGEINDVCYIRAVAA